MSRHMSSVWSSRGDMAEVQLEKKDIKVVDLQILKVKMWFGDKDLFS